MAKTDEVIASEMENPMPDENLKVEQLAPRVIDRALERKLLWKLDTRMLPLVTVMYLFNSIDKASLGNAKTGNLEKDLGLVDNQYNLLLTIFYIPFVLTGPFMNMATKKFGANIVLPIAMMVFGSMAMIGAACVNFGGIFVTRWFLGMAESGFYPGVIYYLTTFYRRRELASRLSTFYAATVTASAFNGLIAYGVFQIKSSLKGWQYLFLIEGSLTILGGIIGLIFLPKSSATAYFLTEEERGLAYYRMASDSSTTVDAEFNLRQGFRVFKSDRLWPLWALLSFAVNVPQCSVLLFLPQIVARLGFDTVKTNLYTVAPNAVAAVITIAVAFSSDYTGDRSLHLACTLTVTFVGFIVLATFDITKHIAVGYTCCFLLPAGAYISSPLLTTWYNNNTPDENQRAILTGVLVALGNAMGLVSSNIFRPQDAPKYILASAITAGFGAVGIILVLGVGFYMKKDNARRNRTQGRHANARDVITANMLSGQKEPGWRWFGGIP